MHEWHSGMLTRSSWHGLETVAEMATAQDLIAAGETSGAYPTDIRLEAMATETGLAVPGAAVVASYADSSRVAHAAVGRRYTPLDPREWRATIEAAVQAGATPAGAFALRGGTRLLATFEIAGGNGGTAIRNYLNLVDSLDGSLQFLAGGTSIRTVCANTLAAAMRADGKHAARLRHTASINDRAEVLRGAIAHHVESGQAVAQLYREAAQAELSRVEAESVFELLFPAASDDDSPRKRGRKTNRRSEAARAMHRAENNAGRTLATLWNGATWLVDRTADGSPRPARGNADKLDSLLFGSRAKRVEEIRNVIEVVLRDGTVSEMSAPVAPQHGVSEEQIGRTILDSALN